MSGSWRTPADSWEAPGPTRGKPPPTPRREPDTHTGSAAAPRQGLPRFKRAPCKVGAQRPPAPGRPPTHPTPGSDRGLEPPTRCTHFPPRARPGSGASCAQSGAVRSPATPLRAARLTCSRWRWRRPGAAACPARPYPPRPAPSCPGH